MPLHIVIVIALNRGLGDLRQVARIRLHADRLRIGPAIDGQAHNKVASRERGNMLATGMHGIVWCRASRRMTGIDCGGRWTARIAAGIEWRLKIESEAVHACGS